ncbi:unnamed protein product [Adineta steineri]|uniref:Uncharacterized protein n=1 Tax=Adineta steineri TaxID=433720 RepID=A0A815W4R4_9BILA|nr:unnamed protein product [Adineta steineri]
MFIIGQLLIYASVKSLSVGRVTGARFTSLNRLNVGSMWLSTFNSWYECMCSVISMNLSSTALALNMYQNGSCQLFVSLPLTYTMETNQDSTLILLQELPPKNLAPCCSNISWLIGKMNSSQQASGNISKPNFVFIDDNDYLVSAAYKGAVIQFNRTTLNIIRSATFGNDTMSINYHNGLYYVADCPSSCNIYVVSSKNLSVVANFSLSSNIIREIIFIRNSSLMVVASNGKNQTLFLNVLSLSNYTSSTPSYISVNRPCGLYAVNDSFIYIGSWYSTTTLTPVSTLTYSNNTWSLSTLPNTTPNGTQKIFQTTIDSCGRLWVAINGYGIKIYDPWGYTLLYSWQVTTGMDGFHLTDNYELFIADFSANKILHFNPNIDQCTS